MEAEERSGSTLEERIGKRWSTWAGAVALLFAGGFYMQMASGRGWIPKEAKVAVAIALGALAIFLGDRFLRRDARVLGQGLVGAGLGVVFGALYGGHALYDLYGFEPAAVALIGVIGAGMVLAVRHDASPIAVLAVLGGLMIPALSSSGADAGAKRDQLFAYLTVLDLGVLGVALARRWRGLEWLAFAGTWVLFAAWYHKTASPEIAVTLAWCAGFFTIFLAVPLAYHLRRRIALSRDRLALLVLDGAVAFGFACEILDGVRVNLGWAALALAAIHVVLGAIVRRRLPGDQLAFATCAILATVFVTLAVPLALREHGIVLGWALEAPVLALLGTHYRLRSVRTAGAAVVILAAGWMLIDQLPSHALAFTPFFNARFASALAVPVAAALYAWIAGRAARRFLDPLGRGHAITTGVMAGMLTLGLVHAEVWQYFVLAGEVDDARLAVLAWWLTATSIALAISWRGNLAAWGAALTLGAGTGVVALMASQVRPSDVVPFLNPRFLLLAVTCVTWLGLWRAERRQLDGGAAIAELRAMVAFWMPIAFLGATWTLITHEAWVQVRFGVADPVRAEWLGHAALSCAWSVYAAALLALGFRLRVPALRWIALGMFGLTVAKVMLVDLSRVEQIYRVTSFLVLGVLLFAVSWLYHRAGSRRS